MEIDMAMVSRFGQMVPNMKDIGKKIRHMVKASFGMLTVMSLMEHGKKIKHMGMGFTFMSMVLSMKVNGKMICNMEKEWKFGQMDQSMMDIIKKGKNMVEVSMFGVTALLTTACGKTT